MWICAATPCRRANFLLIFLFHTLTHVAIVFHLYSHGREPVVNDFLIYLSPLEWERRYCTMIRVYFFKTMSLYKNEYLKEVGIVNGHSLSLLIINSLAIANIRNLSNHTFVLNIFTGHHWFSCNDLSFFVWFGCFGAPRGVHISVG